MFTTKVEIPESPIKITHEDNILTLGSCFSESIGAKLENNCFSVNRNPFGVLYNPLSISNSLNYLLDNKTFTENDLFYHSSLWSSFSYSSLFSGISQEEVLKHMNERAHDAAAFLRKTKFLCITFGTSWVFEYIKSGEVVANCHKLPAQQFVRYRLSIEDIVANYVELIWKLNSLVPEIKILFTVSPIRHWKDGAHENNISKGILHVAVDSLQKQFENVFYFPAYEIVMDELRDYRYYAEDMLHPSQVAVDYIWKRFSEVYFSEDTLLLNKKVDRIKADLAHRPLHGASTEYMEFLRKAEERKSALINEYPFLKNRLS